MASCDWQKIKSATAVKAMLRHSCLDSRLNYEHSNKQINKSLSHKNLHFGNMMYYSTSCETYDKLLSELDAKPDANKRKDRVTAVGLSIPCPENMSDYRSEEWFKGVYDRLHEKYGDYLIGGAVHYDEVHDYVDQNGVKQSSRPHLHAYVLPVVDGKLNAKQFTSKKNMIEMNNMLEEYTKNKFYGYKFLTGTKKKSTKTVEELKNDSAIRMAKQEAEAILNTARKAAESILTRSKEKADDFISELDKTVSELKWEARRSKQNLKYTSEILQAAEQYKVSFENADNALLDYVKNKRLKCPDGISRSVYDLFVLEQEKTQAEKGRTLQEQLRLRNSTQGKRQSNHEQQLEKLKAFESRYLDVLRKAKELSSESENPLDDLYYGR